MNIKRGAFPGCCGIQILWNFGNTAVTPGTSSTISVESIDKAINEALLIKIPGWPDGIVPEKPQPYALTLIALNETQHKKLHRMMKRKGFKLIDKGWNLNHKDMNYLYSIHLEKGEKVYDLK